MSHGRLSSETVGLLRLPLTAGVVFIHYNMGVRGFSIHGSTFGLDAPEWFRWVTALFSDVVPRTAVPLFYIISGLLFFRGGAPDAAGYRRKLRSRARTLLVPYLLWNVIAVLFELAKSQPFLSSVFPGSQGTEVLLTPLRLLRTFSDSYWNRGILVNPGHEGLVSPEPYPADGPLWYVRDLMLMVLLAPLVGRLLRRAGWAAVAALGAVWYVLGTPLLPGTGGWPAMMSSAAFFFTWGAQLSLTGSGLAGGMRRLLLLAPLYLPLALADMLSKGTDCSPFVHRAGVVAGVVAVACLAARLAGSGRTRLAGVPAGASFLVFALHTLVMDDVGKVLFTALRLTPDIPTLLALYLCVPLLTVVLCLAVYFVLRRLSPSLCALLTGGR